MILGSSLLGRCVMHIDTTEQLEPCVVRIQRMLRKIDQLHLPPASRRDLENILVRQVARELDRLFPWQAGHGQDTAAVAIRIGQAMQLDDKALHQLKLAGLLHDIGLVMLPSHLQTRQGSYDADSYVTVQNHPRLGASLLEPFRFLREATIMIAHHHEHWDGSGYPYGLRGTFIPLGARILAVADAFKAIRVPHVCDQLTRDRIALRILQVASGSQFDPLIVNALVGALQETNSSHVQARFHS
jgi:HD-GYP domain-containing protein (c-di-GMP phosphodiesterase class II)